MTLRTVPDDARRSTTLIYFEGFDPTRATPWIAGERRCAAAVEIMRRRVSTLTRRAASSVPHRGRNSGPPGGVRSDEEPTSPMPCAAPKERWPQFDLLCAPGFSTDAAGGDTVEAAQRAVRHGGRSAGPGARRSSPRTSRPPGAPREWHRRSSGPFARGTATPGHRSSAMRRTATALPARQDFSKGRTVERYERFMDELADIIVGKYDGALKAEHGSGRNMAPFVLESGAKRRMASW